jgi:hypothetical protein
MKTAQRGWPKVHMIILFHRRETASATARVRTTLEEACEDVANVSTVATNERRAFFSIVASAVFER